MVVDVSRNARDSEGVQLHGWVSCLGVVWLIVNFIVGCIQFNSSKNKCNFSSRKRFQALIG